MADILPYLGVKQSFSEEDIQGKTVIVEDLTGKTPKEADKLLKDSGLSAQYIGTGDTVTGQIPQSGSAVPGGSQILLYLGETPPMQTVEMPDFVGMNRQQANDAAGALGIYILPTGNQEISPAVIVTTQDIAPKTQVSVGTTVRLEFANARAPD